MSSKRKFSATFETDSDTVKNLMKYRKTTTQLNSNRVSPILVNQEELRCTTDSILRGYEALDADCSVDRKPNYTYTEMIFMSILRSPNYCLPISEIYSYIETRFPFFLEMREQQWKNAVRQSLIKNKCFQKLGIENHNPRSGILNRSAFLWTLLPSCLLRFARGDYRAKKNPRMDLFPSKCNKLSEGCVNTLGERIEAFQVILNQTTNPAKLYSMQVCNIDGEDSGLQNSNGASISSEPISNDKVQQTYQPVPEEAAVLTKYFSSPNDSAFSDSDSSKDSYQTIDISASSGYQSFCELSHLDLESCQDSVSPASEKYWRGVFTNTDSGSLPELTPECIESVPCVPDIPPLKLLFPELVDESHFGLTSFEDFVMFEDDECLNRILNEDDFSILREFLDV